MQDGMTIYIEKVAELVNDVCEHGQEEAVELSRKIEEMAGNDKSEARTNMFEFARDLAQNLNLDLTNSKEVLSKEPATDKPAQSTKSNTKAKTSKAKDNDVAGKATPKAENAKKGTKAKSASGSTSKSKSQANEKASEKADPKADKKASGAKKSSKTNKK